jgi:hypothetical protein
MTFTDATKTAPSGADFIKYTNDIGRIMFVQKTSDGMWISVAETGKLGEGLVAAGISASRKSLWDADAGQMVCGLIEDMFTTSNEE